MPLRPTRAKQLLDLRRYVKERGWSVFEEFADAGISGTKTSRPALDRLMDDARKRQFDVLVVWRFDRFARSVKHLVLALERNIIVERVHAALRRARQQGKRIGRPEATLDVRRAVGLRRAGRTLRQIANALGSSPTKVFKVLNGIEAVSKPLGKSTP